MRAYFLRVLSVSLLSAVCTFLLPKGNVRRFVSPLLSLAVTATVLMPFFTFFQNGSDSFSGLLPDMEAVISASAYENSVEAEYRKRIEEKIENLGDVDAVVSLGENFSVSRIILSGNISTRVMAYITMELEVPRSCVEIR